MKKKNPKDLQKNKKPQQNFSLFIPQQYLSYIQEDSPLSCDEDRSNDTKKYIAEVEPFDIPQEWEEKPEEEINEELFTIKENLDKEKDKETINSKKSNQSRLDKSPTRKKTQRLKLDASNKNNNNNQNNNDNETIDAEKTKTVGQKWKDPMHEELVNNLPLTFIKMTENNISWLTPEEYIINEKLDEEIKRFHPKKDFIKIREEVKEFFKEAKIKEKEKERLEKEKEEKERLQKEQEEKERLEKEKQENKLKKRISKKVSKIPIEAKKKEEPIIIPPLSENIEKNLDQENKNTLEDLLNDDSFIAKQNLYKDYLPYLNWTPDIRILNIDERDETDEEYTSRVSETIEKQKETLDKYKTNKSKKEKKPTVQKPEDIPRNKVITNLPSNISVKHIVDIEKTTTANNKENKN